LVFNLNSFNILISVRSVCAQWFDLLSLTKAKGISVMKTTGKQNLDLFAALVAILLATGCGQNFEPGSPEHVVQSLYKAAATTGIPKDEATLALYFDSRMVELLVNDINCVKDGESCSLLYFDPVAQSNNPDIEDLELIKPPEEHEVYVSFMQHDQEYKAVCVMVRTRDGWRVSDIIYYGADQILEPPGSLLTSLVMQTKPPAPWHPPVPGVPEDAFH
jgi:hypothetical protein